MVHCCPVKMGLTTEVKGCVFSEWHPVFRQPHGAFYSWGEQHSLVINRCCALYSTSLPMCHCIHAKDRLSQLGTEKKKKTFAHQWKDMNSMPCSASQRVPRVGRIQTFPPCLHVSEAFMCVWEHAPHKAQCMFMLSSLTLKCVHVRSPWSWTLPGFQACSPVTQLELTLS